MAIRQALLIELFAIVVVLYGGFSMVSTDLNSNPMYPVAGLCIGVFGFAYGIVGSLVLTALRDET